MPASIGVNLRVTGHCRQGGRKYMEDFFSVAYQQTEDERDLEYAFFGIYDGHGGAEAAAFAKEHLMETIIKHRYFWSDNDEDVLRAIKDGYIATHYNMWKEQEKWPKTTAGSPSTAGTTASVAFIRRGKIYIGHVGDSAIILGYQEPGCTEWKAKQLTKDHKPENVEEMTRIRQCGGKVVAKSGVPRVVWNRPRVGHQGPVRRSTPIDEIPFLAVARSLGDLWSYNSQLDQFVVSPNPDCSVIEIDCTSHRCLIFGTDGLYNMLSPQMAVHIVQQAERHNENATLSDNTNKTWLNPSKLLVEEALKRWHNTKIRADNTSVITLMLDPPGPPRAQVLKSRKKSTLPVSGLKILTRYEQNEKEDCSSCCESSENVEETDDEAVEKVPRFVSKEEVGEFDGEPSSAVDSESVTSSDLSDLPLKERNFVPKTRESTSFDPREECSSISESPDKENVKTRSSDDSIQINEISSSSSDVLEVNEEADRVKTSKCQTKDDGSESKEFERSSRKRKTPDKENSPVRKSVRIDLRKQSLGNRVGSCCDHDSSTNEHRHRHVPLKPAPAIKLSLTQKILRSKKLAMKKKLLIKRPIVGKKLKTVLDAVRRTTGARRTVVKPKKPDVEKERPRPSRVSMQNAPKVSPVKRLVKNNVVERSLIKNNKNQRNVVNVLRHMRSNRNVARNSTTTSTETRKEKVVRGLIESAVSASPRTRSRKIGLPEVSEIEIRKSSSVPNVGRTVSTRRSIKSSTTQKPAQSSRVSTRSKGAATQDRPRKLRSSL